MGRRKGSKNKVKNSGKKGLKALKNLRGNGGGGYLVRIYGDTATLRGTVETNKNGLVAIKHKRPGLGVVRTIVAEENIVSTRAGSVVIRGVPVEEFFATRIVRKDGITYAETLEGERVTLPTTNFEITTIVEEEVTEEETESESDDEGEEEEKKEEEEEEEEEEDEKPKKKKKKDADEEEGDSDDDWGI